MQSLLTYLHLRAYLRKEFALCSILRRCAVSLPPQTRLFSCFFKIIDSAYNSQFGQCTSCRFRQTSAEDDLRQQGLLAAQEYILHLQNKQHCSGMTTEIYINDIFKLTLIANSKTNNHVSVCASNQSSAANLVAGRKLFVT